MNHGWLELVILMMLWRTSILHHIPEAAAIICHQVGPAPYKERGAFSTCFPNTAQLIRFGFMDNYCAVSCPKALKHPTELPSAAPSPPSSICHGSISHILVCNKAEIKRLYAQLKHNESWEVLSAAGLAGLQRMWYLETMRSGFICQWARPALWKAAPRLHLQEMLDVFEAHTLKDNTVSQHDLVVRLNLWDAHDMLVRGSS